MIDIKRTVEFTSFNPKTNELVVHIRTSGVVDDQKIDTLNTQGAALLDDATAANIQQACRDAITKLIIPVLNTAYAGVVDVPAAPIAIPAPAPLVLPPTPSPVA